MKRCKVQDFVRKPFLALIGCCQRRPASPIFSGIACFGDLTMNIGTRSWAGGRAFGQSLALFALILGLLVLQVESGTAGPVLPEQRVISDELLSLVGVASSRLQVNVRWPGKCHGEIETVRSYGRPRRVLQIRKPRFPFTMPPSVMG